MTKPVEVKGEHSILSTWSGLRYRHYRDNSMDNNVTCLGVKGRKMETHFITSKNLNTFTLFYF